MTGETYRVPYSKSYVEFSLAPEMRVTVAESKAVTPLEDPGRAIREALTHPIGSPPLRELAQPGTRACIAFTDSTRACPDQLLVPALLAELKFETKNPGGNDTIRCLLHLYLVLR